MGDPETLALEHEAVRTAVAALRALLAVGPPDGSPARLAGDLRRLHERLRSHFELEERGGYFAVTLAERPWLARAIERLQQEHIQLLADGEVLVATLQVCATVADAAGALSTFLDRLAHHERDEFDLLQRAELDDLGRGG